VSEYALAIVSEVLVQTQPRKAPTRLKALLIHVIKRLVKYEPDALELLEQLNPSDPDDGLGDL
jgi:hypothetical protein